MRGSPAAYVLPPGVCPGLQANKALKRCAVLPCSADEGDVLLLCDGCDQGAHLRCCGLKAVPRGEWLCAECAPSKGSRKVCPAARAAGCSSACACCSSRPSMRVRSHPVQSCLLQLQLLTFSIE